MFYAQFVLSKKGPLAKIWLAAHWEKKLSKAQIYETNVQDAVDEILKPKVKMALRTTGHLLLGIVRIYSRKTKYLLADCNEAFLKIKMAFRPGQAELLDDGKEVAPTKLPGLPEVFTDFDAALPDFNDMEFANQMQVNQSRLDDITLKEDLIPDQGNMFNSDFGMDDFGEMAAGAMGDMDHDFADLGNGGLNEFNDFPMHNNSSNIEAGRHETSSMRDIREATPLMVLDAKAQGPIFNEDDFGGAGDVDDFMDVNVVPFNDNMSAILPLDAPGADIQDDLQLGAAANNLHGDMQESFALEPLEAGALDRLPRRNARKRRLIIDEQKNINGEEMKANMADYSDTLQSLDLAPPTKKLMRMKEAGAVEKLFQLPGCSFLKAKPLVKLYQSHLVMRARTDAETPIADDIRRDLDLSETIDEDIYAPPDSHFGDDFDDIAPLPMPDFRSDTPPPMAELEALPEESPVKEQEETHTPDKKKRKSANEKIAEEEESILEGDEDHRWTKRTQGVLNSIATKLKANDEIVLADLLNKGSTRKNAAQKFYTLLVLKKWQAIDVRQDEPYGDIIISAGPNITQTVAQ